MQSGDSIKTKIRQFSLPIEGGRSRQKMLLQWRQSRDNPPGIRTRRRAKLSPLSDFSPRYDSPIPGLCEPAHHPSKSKPMPSDPSSPDLERVGIGHYVLSIGNGQPGSRPREGLLYEFEM
jgi:hypothetical protein